MFVQKTKTKTEFNQKVASTRPNLLVKLVQRFCKTHYHLRKQNELHYDKHFLQLKKVLFFHESSAKETSKKIKRN